MDDKLEKLLKALYEKKDKNSGQLPESEEGMMVILNVVLDKDEDTLDELLEDSD